MQKELTSKKFIQQLQEFDLNSVTDKIQRRVTEYLQRPNFNEEYMRSKSDVAGDLCAWVIAVASYVKLVKDSSDKVTYLGGQQETLT